MTLPAELRARKPLCRLSQRAADRIEELERRVAELEGALKPFAEAAKSWPGPSLESGVPLYVVQRFDGAPQPVAFSLADLGRALRARR